MASATFFYADRRDVDELLGYLGVGRGTVLRPWPLVVPDRDVARAEIHDHAHVLVVAAAMGEPVLAGEHGAALGSSGASRWLHRMIFESAQRAGVEQIVDLEASPVLFWKPGRCDEGRLVAGRIGTQADQLADLT